MDMLVDFLLPSQRELHPLRFNSFCLKNDGWTFEKQILSFFFVCFVTFQGEKNQTLRGVTFVGLAKKTTKNSLKDEFLAAPWSSTSSKTYFFFVQVRTDTKCLPFWSPVGLVRKEHFPGSMATRLWWWWEIHLRSTILRHCRRFARCFLRRTTGDLFERHGLWGRVTGFRGVKVVEIWGFQGWSNKMRFVFSKKQSDDLMGPTGIESWVGRLIQMIERELTWCTTSSSWWGSLLSILF